MEAVKWKENCERELWGENRPSLLTYHAEAAFPNSKVTLWVSKVCYMRNLNVERVRTLSYLDWKHSLRGGGWVGVRAVRGGRSEGAMGLSDGCLSDGCLNRHVCMDEKGQRNASRDAH